MAPEFATMLNAALTALASSAVGALVGALVARARSLSKARAEDRAEMDAMRDGIRSLLRNEVMRLHHECVRRGSATTVEKEVLQRSYEAYRALGGNGVVKALHEEFMALPTVED